MQPVTRDGIEQDRRCKTKEPLALTQDSDSEFEEMNKVKLNMERTKNKAHKKQRPAAEAAAMVSAATTTSQATKRVHFDAGEYNVHIHCMVNISLY